MNHSGTNPKIGGQSPYLVLLDSGLPESSESGRRYELTEDEILIGSSPHMNIELSSEVVAPAHARLYRREGQWFLQNLRKTNDVFVDGMVVGIHSLKRDGESFTLGKATFAFMQGQGPWSKYHEEAEQRSDTDPLLQIANRRAFEKAFKSAMSLLSRRGGSIALVMFDIDHFKNHNTEFGHLGADKILKELTWRVNSRIREEELFARWGGEEFVLLMRDTNHAQAITFAERLRQLVGQEPFIVKGRTTRVTISVGIASTEREMEIEELSEIANQFLHQAKQKGRDQVAG